MAAPRNKSLPVQLGDTRVFTRPEVSELLDRVAALSPETADALDRDTACAVLLQLHELQRRRGPGPYYVTCPSCRGSFDVAHSRPCAGPPKPPPHHPDPIGAADSAAGAREVARALGQALLRSDNQVDSAPFWVEMAVPVLWPLLLAARAAGRDMEGVRLQAHPDRIPETLISVATALKQLPPGPDVDAARREWASVRAFDDRHRRAVFACAFGMVELWLHPTMPSRRPVSSLRFA